MESLVRLDEPSGRKDKFQVRRRWDRCGNAEFHLGSDFYCFELFQTLSFIPIARTFTDDRCNRTIPKTKQSPRGIRWRTGIFLLPPLCYLLCAVYLPEQMRLRVHLTLNSTRKWQEPYCSCESVSCLLIEWLDIGGMDGFRHLREWGKHSRSFFAAFFGLSIDRHNLIIIEVSSELSHSSNYW